jgi:hypothetical protein
MNDADLPESTSGERYILQAEEELRIETTAKECCVTLVRGSCELWGLELALNCEYNLACCKLALFTWHGCVLQVTCDNIESVYVSEETATNVAFVNTHAQLEAMRDEALAAESAGPRVLIVGPSESGKSVLTRVLVAYGTSRCLLLSFTFCSTTFSIAVPFDSHLTSQQSLQHVISHQTWPHTPLGRFGPVRQRIVRSRNTSSGSHVDRRLDR